MWLNNYAAVTRQHVEELRQSLSEGEVEQLRGICASRSLGAMYQWLYENLEEVQEYLAATPSQRSRKKAWRDPERRLVMVWAACIHAHQASALLDTVTEANLLEAEGTSYRDMTALAAGAYLRVFLWTIDEWPFDGPNPFSQG